MKRSILCWLFTVLLTATQGCAVITNYHFKEMKNYEADPSLAQYSGKAKVKGLEGKVEVYRDNYGVPHIFSENEHDLFFAIGYVQAQDRLWEMATLRAVAEGRTAEIFGKLGVPGVEMAGMPLSTVGLDAHQRMMGNKYIGEISEAMLRETNPKIFRQCQAFCDGVNAYIDSLQNTDDLPVEFRILRIRPEHWRVADIASFGRFIGTMLCSNMEIEIPRYAAIKKYGPEKGWELFPLYNAPGPVIVPTEILKNRLDTPRDLPPGGRPSDGELGYELGLSARSAQKISLAESAYRAALGITPALGSNNWVVSGKLTESGNAILANDPHLQHIQPSLFYLMRVKGAGYDCYGVTFPGNPYVVLGHTKKLAWGATTSRADVQDVFIEKTVPGKPDMYLYKGEQRPFTVRREIIRIRSGSRMKQKEIEIRQSIHGPIINDYVKGLPEDTPAAAMRWTGWDISRDTRAFEMAASSGSAEEFMQKYRNMHDKFEFINICLSLERLMRGNSIKDFIEAMSMLAVPNQNWVAADADGHIAYLPGGLVPVRKNGIGALPVPGESGKFDWQGFIPLMEIPHAIDPDRGWMVTANNQVVDGRYYPYVFSTHYGEPWRAWRIEELLAELGPLDVEDMRRVQNDVQVRRAAWQVPMILDAVERKKPTDKRVLEAARELEKWDYESDLDSTATVIFFEFVKALHSNVLEDDVDKAELKAMRIEGYPDMMIDTWLARGQSQFFDDSRTRGKVEDMDDMIVKSLADAMKKVGKKWGKKKSDRTWGDIHVIKWFHILGVGRGSRMSVGPYPHIGGDQTVRNAKVAGFGRVPYKSMTGPCMRHIIDMGDPDAALIIIDGSQSGQWLSPHYDDMHEMFVNSEYIEMHMEPARVKREARYKLLLEP